MSAKTRFVVLTSQRTGSSWVMDVLNGLEGAKTYGELFLPVTRDSPEVVSNDYPRYVDAQKRRFRPFSVFSYLNGLYRQDPAIGFKLMYSHLRAHPEILPYLVARRIRVVHLVRRNHLDVVISATRARVTGRAHVREGEKRDGKVTVRLDPAALLPRLHRLRRNQRWIRAALKACLLAHVEVGYEDLLHHQASYGPVLEFLGLTLPEELTTHLVKRGKGSYEDVVENLDEVRELLLGTEFEAFLAQPA